MKTLQKITYSALLFAFASTINAKPKTDDLATAAAEISKSNYTAAINLMTSYISNHEMEPQAYYYRSLAELGIGENDLALKDIDLAIQLDKKFQIVKKLSKSSKIKQADLLLQRAKCYRALGNTETAMEELKKAALADNTLADIYVEMGEIYASRNDFKGSDTTFAKALRYDSKNYNALMGLAKNYINNERERDAISKLDQAIAVDGEKIEPYMLRYKANIGLQNYERAFDDISYVASSNEDYNPYLADLSNAASKCVTYSMPKIDQKIKADENTVLWLQCRAAVDNKIGKFEAAIEDYTKLENILGEKYAITSSGKGDCYFQKGDYNTALAMYKEANELEETAAANAGIARILLLQNESTEALVYANKAVSLDPMNYEYYYLRGRVQEMRKMTGDAISDYEVGMQINSNYAPLYYRRGIIKKSKKDFERVIKLETAPSATENHKPFAYLYIGKQNDGKRSIKEILKVYPNADNYYTAASFYAAINDTANALTSLEKSFELGYRNFSQVDSDSNLDSLRTKTSYIALVDKWKKASGVSANFAKAEKSDAQKAMVTTEVKFRREQQKFALGCKLNNLDISCLLDTAATIGSISFADALFLTKYGYIQAQEWSQDPYKDLTESTVVTIRELEIEGIKVKGLIMKVTNDKNAKLQLSKNDIAKFGNISVNNQRNILLIEHY